MKPHSEQYETPGDEGAEPPATQQAEAKAGIEKNRFPMKGRANLAMHMLRRAEATSKATASAKSKAKAKRI